NPKQVTGMPETMTSRERMLAALGCAEVDYVPCSFMIFSALRERYGSDEEFVRRQVAMGLDPCVATASWASARNLQHRDLPGIDLRYPPGVQVRQWRESRPDAPDLLHKEYHTPDGVLKTEVLETDDWPYPGHVPLFDDYLVPRAVKFPVEGPGDLPALRHLLAPPHPDDVAAFHEGAANARRLADELGLLLTGGMGVGIEAGAWLCGQEELVYHAVDRPEMVEELAEIIHEWNAARMREVLAMGVDLFLRRAWYEGTDFWSPPMYRRFVLPFLKREVELAHEAGARFAYINTTGTIGILQMLLEAGVDVVIGIDPVQGVGTDMAQMRRMVGNRMALWGGVNGFVTVELGSDEEIREAVRLALEELGPRGLILSPVDNIRDTSEQTMRRVEVFIDAWRQMR
ncbi:MAG TPA: uroporphyrinogen decarboxylase family protein, partial [Armatimonadota bacterium]|nr:uroporphyrinogen decarboxylase family protein [Armatimonadota bacterium]